MFPLFSALARLSVEDSATPSRSQVTCRLVKPAVRAGQEERRNGRRRVGDEAMLLLLLRFPLGSNYQLDELRRVSLRIDIVSNAQLAADTKIRWVRISSQLVNRCGLLTRMDIQKSRRTPLKTRSRCRLVHFSSLSRLGLLSTVHCPRELYT